MTEFVERQRLRALIHERHSESFEYLAKSERRELREALQNLVGHARAHGLDEAGGPVQLAAQTLQRAFGSSANIETEKGK